MRADDFGTAVRAFQDYAAGRPLGPAAYRAKDLKMKRLSGAEALVAARAVIERLTPEWADDPETLRTNRAIRNGLWNVLSDQVQLGAAIRSYDRGFEIQ